MVTKQNKMSYKPLVFLNDRGSPEVEGITKDEREFRRLLQNNAEVAALVLNASKGTKVYTRLATLRRDLEELNLAAERLQPIYLKLRRTPKGSPRHREVYGAFDSSWKGLLARLNAMNLTLARYSFNLFLGYGVPGNTKYYSMPAVVNWRSKRLWSFRLGRHDFIEADAVLALVRLDANGELGKVHLCSHCKKRWHVARRSIDRFCSAQCREAFYIESPEYRPRKRENQRKYREQKKRHDLL